MEYYPIPPKKGNVYCGNSSLISFSIELIISIYDLTFKDVKTWRTLDNFFSVGPNKN